MTLGCADYAQFPLFLTKGWFPPSNASALRGHLRWLILQMFQEQSQASQSASVAQSLEQAEVDLALYQQDSRSYIRLVHVQGASSGAACIEMNCVIT